MAAVGGVGTPTADITATPVDVDDGRERMSSRVEPTTTGSTAAASAERE
jgi:type V secretory pathway adhesin AidA